MSNVPPIYFFNGAVPAPPPGYQNAQWQTDNGFPTQSFSDAVPNTGNAQEITTNYTATDADCGSLIAANSPTGVTILLPFPIPFEQWCLFVINLGSGPLTIASAGGTPPQINGRPSLILNQNEGAYIATDFANYFAERGGGSSSSITPSPVQFADNETPSGAINGANLIFTLVNPPNPPGSLQLYARFAAINSILLNPSDYTLSARTVTLSIAAPSGADKLRAWYRYLGNGQTPQYKITFTNATRVPFQTNLNTFNLIPGVWDASNGQIVYGTFQLIDLNDVLLTFPTPQSGTLIVTPSVYQQSFLNQVSLLVPHNLNSLNIIAVVYDAGNNQIIQLGLKLIDANNATLTFPSGTPQSGTILIMSPAGAYSQSFTGQTSITITHNKGSLLTKAVAYDGSNNQITFKSYAPVDSNNSTLTFASAQTGRVVVALP